MCSCPFCLVFPAQTPSVGTRNRLKEWRHNEPDQHSGLPIAGVLQRLTGDMRQEIKLQSKDLPQMQLIVSEPVGQDKPARHRAQTGMYGDIVPRRIAQAVQPGNRFISFLEEFLNDCGKILTGILPINNPSGWIDAWKLHAGRFQDHSGSLTKILPLLIPKVAGHLEQGPFIGFGTPTDLFRMQVGQDLRKDLSVSGKSLYDEFGSCHRPDCET